MRNYLQILFILVFTTEDLYSDSFTYNSFNNHGVIGLINMPSARFYDEAAHGITIYDGGTWTSYTMNDGLPFGGINQTDFDSNGDGLIDLRSEFVFGHAQNCAKRDRKKNAEGVAYTDFSKEAMDAFLVGRRILENAEAAGELTEAANEALQAQISIAAKTWEECIAATVVHYINDVSADMEGFSGENFADLDNFINLTKHWGEMKGFALGLQFSPLSPFRDGSTDKSVDDLKRVLALMGDAPVMPNGSQNGQAAAVDSAEAITNYLSDLEEARTILAEAYAFDPEVVPIW